MPTVGNSIHHHNGGKERATPDTFHIPSVHIQWAAQSWDKLLCVKSMHFSFMPSEEKWNIWSSLQDDHLKELLSTTILSNLRKKRNINIWNNCSRSFFCLFVCLLVLLLFACCCCWPCCVACQVLVLWPGIELGLWQWKCQVLDTGLAENPLLVLVAYDKIKLEIA